MERKSLSDILRGSDSGSDWIGGNWGDISPAPEYGPIPTGRYIAHAVEGELFSAGTGTPGYKITFAIAEGDYEGRRVWYDIWLTGAAKAQAVRDFGKLGIRSKEQLERPLPRGIRCDIQVVKRKNDQGNEYNAVKSFTVLGIDPEERDPFGPSEDQQGGPDQ
jgi:hypothetical protein